MKGLLQVFWGFTLIAFTFIELFDVIEYLKPLWDSQTDTLTLRALEWGPVLFLVAGLTAGTYLVYQGIKSLDNLRGPFIEKLLAKRKRKDANL